MKLSVVIPVYNNSLSLRELSAGVESAGSEVSQEVEIIYVDDGSSDLSLSILEDIARARPSVTVLALSRNFGQHAAISAGFAHASGDVIVLMDADLQDPPDAIPLLVRKLQDTNVDIVFTEKIRERRNRSIFNTSKVFLSVFSRMTASPVPSGIGTQRAFTRQVLVAINSFTESKVVYGPLMNYIGFDYAIVPVRHAMRKAGKSSYTFGKRLNLALDTLVSFSDLPHRVSTGFGVLATGASLVYGLAIVAQYLTAGASLPSGMTLVLLAVLFFGGSSITILGISGLYLSRIYQEVLHRPRYIIRNKIGAASRGGLETSSERARDDG